MFSSQLRDIMIIQHFVPYNWRQEEPSVEEEASRRQRGPRRGHYYGRLRTPRCFCFGKKKN